jgi:hypothetical protein
LDVSLLRTSTGVERRALGGAKNVSSSVTTGGVALTGSVLRLLRFLKLSSIIY